MKQTRLRSDTFIAIGIVIVALIVVGVAAVSARSQVDPFQRSSPAPSALKAVKYFVGGSVRTANITYTNASGGTEQRSVRLPWSLAMEKPAGSFLYAAAQKQDEDGSIQAVIYVDGQIVQQAQSDTAYGIATASGRVR